MRSLVVVCLFVRAAASDPDTDWDGTYKVEGNGGGELCPHFEKPSATVDVVGSVATLDWKIRAADDSLVKVGTLKFTTRPSGLATLDATLLTPMPRQALAKIEEMSDSVEKLQAMIPDLKLRFSTTDYSRDINLAAKVGDCYASWRSEGAPKHATAKKASTPAPALKACYSRARRRGTRSTSTPAGTAKTGAARPAASTSTSR
ncbi:MAG: hypothetical protein QM831_36730 [Kofleriaceae bacterium]